MSGGELVEVKLGSKAARKAIEEYQPKVFLCGHIHESLEATWIGNTLCMNPGSATSWSSWNVVLTGSSDDAPAVSAFDGRLWMAVKGRGSNSIYVDSMDLASGAWSGWTRPDESTPSCRALTASSTKLYLAARGLNNKIYWRDRSSGSSPLSRSF